MKEFDKILEKYNLKGQIKTISNIDCEYNLIRDFQKETNTYLDAEKEIKHEEREKRWDLER